ncbi:MAG: hypothetical protein OEZ48_00470 [Candidatus Bathyarchaeota archaeon]|nr:hypothetical protein [Candidatus Bathyarchaeota archaeon]MDH5686330.1 hypothetical protein [Candidatus Bathyarchaeota archaeon]
MKLFSQRKGIKPIKTKMQIDSMDQHLRNRLWNALETFYWRPGRLKYTSATALRLIQGLADYSDGLLNLFTRIWDDFLKVPLDTMSLKWSDNHTYMRDYFFSKASWYDVYDLIEFVAEYYPQEASNKNFMDACNSVLESEMSAYRFVGGKITQVTAEEEISEIEEALDIPLKPVHDHLKKSLELFSDKKSPDYPNSVKESISAVESMCNKITGMKKSTLGKCLDRIDSVVPIHGALREAFDHLYGYASSEEGIRHGSIKQSDVDFEIAKFMLVSCSAFVNYLILKASKAGIKI